MVYGSDSMDPAEAAAALRQVTGPRQGVGQGPRFPAQIALRDPVSNRSSEGKERLPRPLGQHSTAFNRPTVEYQTTSDYQPVVLTESWLNRVQLAVDSSGRSPVMGRREDRESLVSC